MAGSIDVSHNECWFTSNWIYWGLMGHLMKALADDPAAYAYVETSFWMQSLSIPDLLEEDTFMAARVQRAMKLVAERCAKGELFCYVEGRLLGDEDQRVFQTSTSKLLLALERHGG